MYLFPFFCLQLKQELNATPKFDIPSNLGVITKSGLGKLSRPHLEYIATHALGFASADRAMYNNKNGLVAAMVIERDMLKEALLG